MLSLYSISFLYKVVGKLVISPLIVVCPLVVLGHVVNTVFPFYDLYIKVGVELTLGRDVCINVFVLFQIISGLVILFHGVIVNFC